MTNGSADPIADNSSCRRGRSEDLANCRLSPLDLALGEDGKVRLPAVAGGPDVVPARVSKVIVPELKNPRSEEWERARAVFDLPLQEGRRSARAVRAILSPACAL